MTAEIVEYRDVDFARRTFVVDDRVGFGDLQWARRQDGLDQQH